MATFYLNLGSSSNCLGNWKLAFLNMTAFIDFKQIFAIYQQTIMFSLENTKTKSGYDIYIRLKILDTLPSRSKYSLILSFSSEDYSFRILVEEWNKPITKINLKYSPWLHRRQGKTKPKVYSHNMKWLNKWFGFMGPV